MADVRGKRYAATDADHHGRGEIYGLPTLCAA
jgi:hypothetical protein